MRFGSFVTFLLFSIRNLGVFVDKFHHYHLPQSATTSNPNKTRKHSSTPDIYTPSAKNKHKKPQQPQNIYNDLLQVTLIYQIHRKVLMKVDE